MIEISMEQNEENEVESTLISPKAISMQWNWGYWAIRFISSNLGAEPTDFNNWLFRLIQLKQINQQQQQQTHTMFMRPSKRSLFITI